MTDRLHGCLRRVLLFLCTLAACAVSGETTSAVFHPVEPFETGTQESPLFRFDAGGFGGAKGRTIDGLPISGFASRTFRIVAPNDSLASMRTRIEIVEDDGSRFVDIPPVRQLVAESETHPGDRVGLYEIGGDYFGTALVDGILHELVPGGNSTKGEPGLYRFHRLDPEDGPAPGWCETETTPESIEAQIDAEATAAEHPEPARSRGVRASAVATREVDFAIECAWEHVSRFADVDAAIRHVLAVVAEVNNIYIRDVGVQFRISHMRMWNTPADIYTGPTSSDYLVGIMNEMRRPSAPATLTSSDLAHLFTANANAGGAAFLAYTCPSSGANMGYSDLTSSDEYPFTGYSWSVDVTAHEVGHNLGSPHTHCYSPPIDNCWGVEPGCFAGNFTRTEGTIMSYCHVSSATRLEFHPRVITVLKVAVQGYSCLADVPTSPADIYENDDAADLAKPLGGQNWQSRSIFPAGDVDWATIDLNHWAGIAIATEGTSGDTVLTLLDPWMNVLATSDDIDAGNPFSRIEAGCADTPLAPGRYYVRVEEKGGDDTIAEYKLSFSANYCEVDQYEPDDTFAQATPVTLGIVQQHSILPAGDGDILKFTLASPTAFVARVEGPDIAAWFHMFLFDSTFKQIDEGAGSVCELSRNCGSAPTPAGTYYLKIIGQANSKVRNYTVRLFPCGPKAVVTQGDMAIPDGSGPVDFGATQQGLAQLARTFRVRNYGSAPLALSNLSVPEGFVVSDGLAPTLASGAFDVLAIELPPASPGVRSGSVSFATNDPDAPLYDFTVAGEVGAQSSEVAVFDGTTKIANGGDVVDFGRAAVGGSALSRTFAVRNMGTLPLATGNLAVPAEFSISEPLASVIPGSSSGLEIKSASPALVFGANPTFLDIPLVFSTPGPIAEVTVNVDVTHPSTYTLGINLFHPDNTRVVLFPNLGDFGKNLTDTTFDDSAAMPITSATPPFTGTFRPSSPLSAFKGKNAAGTWRLQFVDPQPPNPPSEPKLINSYTVTVRTEAFGQDTFTVQLPTADAGEFSGTASFDTDDGDENPFSFPVAGFVGEVPTLASFTLAGGAAAQSANPVPFAFTESGIFPATSVEVCESADFASFVSFPVPGGPFAFPFASGISGPRTLHARLRNESGAGNVRSASTIFDNQPPTATVGPAGGGADWRHGLLLQPLQGDGRALRGEGDRRVGRSSGRRMGVCVQPEQSDRQLLLCADGWRGNLRLRHRRQGHGGQRDAGAFLHGLQDHQRVEPRRERPLSAPLPVARGRTLDVPDGIHELGHRRLRRTARHGRAHRAADREQREHGGSGHQQPCRRALDHRCIRRLLVHDGRADFPLRYDTAQWPGRVHPA